ncbi:helix-turn-helix domain-containing GNAT family N-acetyltransferase [Isoptericola halotolerans]|uniref:DNA-binding MarR family transcriptional regulator/N-acetylglutamate synthase-like GNAT family acetyltransferase n=1 Tax=Isoptericola halotolerans TaxID=300560 RepID=A0ABX2A567_9MICO|nr:bifunctional helix-turn-helix transcriptional regulator/GNAT family N-acetyltransferase [Isoptericola halotolerans]NOV96736.1 DNA-binding MarR family transcriptional regulator/N-acetylglutamate synthase-like GNAT family acetyltransferase [Isoptericola halotolerans]
MTASAPAPDPVDVVRRFNRSYTQRVGALDESFLGSGMPLGRARLLYEIGVEPGTTQDLRTRLGLDSGYLSRLLRDLEADALVTVEPDPADRRRRTVALTDEGRQAWGDLERRSAERARGLVEPLTARQQSRLAAALAEADLLVRAATIELETVAPAADLARRAVRAYVDEVGARIGGTGTFDADEALADDAARLVAPRGAFVVATSAGSPVACGGVQTLGPGVGEIKRMWVDDAWRGAGLGSRLLRHLEQVARELGHTELRLDTHEALTEAIAMYERAGYRRIERYNDNLHATHFFSTEIREFPRRGVPGRRRVGPCLPHPT